MKNLRFLMIALFGFAAIANAISLDAKAPDDELIAEIKLSADSFEKAVEKRNFKEAKEHLEALFPLIKKEMKQSKKYINELEKSGQKSAAKEIKATLKQKTEIHDKLHGIVDVSTAALRGRATAVSTLVKDYIDLLPKDDQLVSAND